MNENSSQFAENYYRISENNEKIVYLSKISQKLNKYATYFNGIVPILFFVNLIKTKKNYYIIIGLLCALLNPIISNVILGNRFILITNILFIVFLLILFKNFFDKATKKKIIKYSSLLVTISILIIGSITYFRFSDMETELNLWDWTTLYSGESFVNFNSDMWHIEKLTNGDNSFFYYKYILGLYDYPDRHYLFLEPISGIRMNVFYTFIGDFFVDFGKYFTPIFVILISLLFLKLTKYKKIIPIHKLIYLILISKVCVIGFTFFTYLNYQSETLITTLTGFLMIFFKNDTIIKRKMN